MVDEACHNVEFRKPAALFGFSPQVSSLLILRVEQCWAHSDSLGDESPSGTRSHDNVKAFSVQGCPGPHHLEWSTHRSWRSFEAPGTCLGKEMAACGGTAKGFAGGQALQQPPSAPPQTHDFIGLGLLVVIWHSTNNGCIDGKHFGW